ncbi:MAG: DUF4252 domain-containing protein [Bacteroidales bacterium]|nr:DUF4252 domain-containing protein [Bacteroidales bacterium]
MRHLYITFYLLLSFLLLGNAGAAVEISPEVSDPEIPVLSMQEYRTLEIIAMDGSRIENFRYQNTLNASRDEFLGLYVKGGNGGYYVARPLGGKPIRSIYWQTSKGVKGLLLNGRSFGEYWRDWRDEQKALEQAMKAAKQSINQGIESIQRQLDAIEEKSVEVPLNKANANSFYSKWAEKEGVSATYISRSMFKMIRKIPQIQLDRPVDLTPVIKNLDGLYMLEFNRLKRNTADGGLRKDIQTVLKGHEKLMERREGELVTRLFMATDGKTVSSFVMTRMDVGANYGQFVCIEGAIPQSEFEKVIAEGMNQ